MGSVVGMLYICVYISMYVCVYARTFMYTCVYACKLPYIAHIVQCKWAARLSVSKWSKPTSQLQTSQQSDDSSVWRHTNST